MISFSHVSMKKWNKGIELVILYSTEANAVSCVFEFFLFIS